MLTPLSSQSWGGKYGMNEHSKHLSQGMMIVSETPLFRHVERISFVPLFPKKQRTELD